METSTLMPWVRFTDNFDWQPNGARWMMTFKAGQTRLVKQVIAQEAIRQGKGKIVERPYREPKDEHASR